jgi:hypothetical protein
MISDPAALKYILNSSHFRLGPLRDSTAHLLFGDKSVVTVNGRFLLLPICILRIY